jgi:hypothetical protein
VEFGKDQLQQPGLVQELKSGAGLIAQDDFMKFVTDAFLGNDIDSKAVVMDGLKRFRFDSEVQPGGEADGTQHTQGII